MFVFEYITTSAAARWFPGEIYVISQTVPLTCILMMRWGGYAALHAVTGGIAYCVAAGGRAEQFVVYCLGNCFALLALILFKAPGKEGVRSRWYCTVGYTVTAFCGAQLGRWIVSLLFGAPAGSLLSFFTADSLTLLYAVVFVLIARRADGIFEDQKAYLLRTEAERNRE